MRLWHKDLIQYLPRKQLIAQWRECCAICSNWANKGTPNHILVNKVTEYSKVEFCKYSNFIIKELECRKYKVSNKSKANFFENYCRIPDWYSYCGGLFEGWHNDRYLKQCLMNLQEKYDCGGISEDEWKIIENRFGEFLK